MDVNFLQQHIDLFKFTFPNLVFKYLEHLNSCSVTFIIAFTKKMNAVS